MEDRPEDPEVLLYLWEWYWEIRAGEQRGEWSGLVVPLSYVEIDAWQRVTGYKVSSSERDLLFRLDRRRRAVMQQIREARNGGRAQAGGR